MQPFWRNDESLLTHLASTGENWPMLRKGGTAGIYIIMMGLSLWIKAKQKNSDSNAWTAVNDVLWVIKQMTQGIDSPILGLKKQTLEADDEDKGELQRKKMYVFDYLGMTYC